MEMAIGDYLKKCFEYIAEVEYIHQFFIVSKIYFMYCVLHYCIPHMYVYFCVPFTLVGILMSPFISQAPHCVALRYMLYTFGDNIKTMFLLISGWFASFLSTKSV